MCRISRTPIGMNFSPSSPIESFGRFSILPKNFKSQLLFHNGQKLYMSFNCKGPCRCKHHPELHKHSNNDCQQDTHCCCLDLAL